MADDISRIRLCALPLFDGESGTEIKHEGETFNEGVEHVANHYDQQARY